MRRKIPEDEASGDDSALLKQPDLGGGQAHDDRPKGTRPVGAFAGPESESATPRASGWRVRPGEAEAASEDGVPGSNAVRFSDAIEAGVMPGTAGNQAAEVRGALYDGPERRKQQESSDLWERADRRERLFVYAGDQD